LQAVRLLAALLEPHECAACVCLLMRELARRARCSFALPPSAAQPSSCVFLALAAALCGQPPVLAAWGASTGLHQDLEAFLSRKQPNATDLAQVRLRRYLPVTWDAGGVGARYGRIQVHCISGRSHHPPQTMLLWNQNRWGKPVCGKISQNHSPVCRSLHDSV
jgi:hypothetical protein